MRRFGTVVTVMAALLALPGSALSAVQIGPQQIVVTGGEGARAVIDRTPFRMTFQDASGQTVLRQVPSLGVPVPGATLDPEPLNNDNVPDTSVYAPLTFEVGGERSVQYPGALYQGNMLIGGKGGIAHSAKDVTKADPSGDGVRLELSTTDPTRSLIVTVTPDTGTGIRVQAELSRSEGVASFSDSFESPAGEAFRGFGGRHNRIDQRGNDFYNWIEQENQTYGRGTAACDANPGNQNQSCNFPNGPEAAYYVHNLFISSQPYGFLLNRTALSRWRMASERPDAWQFAVDESALDYTVAVGAGPKAIETITAINGRHRLPPEYAMGPNLKQGVTLFGDESVASYSASIRKDLEEIEKRKLPLTGYSYEGWRALPRDFVRETNERLRKMGIHPHGYLRAFVGADGDFFDNEALFNEAIENGYVAKTPTGQPYIYQGGGPSAVIDFTNPAAVKWWERRVREMLDLGFDGFMNDFGEQVVYDMVFANGETGRTMHNRYPTIHHEVTREITERYEKEHPGREIFFYTRAGFSGRPGSAAFDESNFPGDETADYSRASGLASLTTDMLSRAVGGSVGFNTDIGGYFNTVTEDGDGVTKDLFIRWSQWSALAPFYRVHNSCCNEGSRLPYSFDEQTVDIWRKFADLHIAATPLIRKLWRETERTGMPINRPMWLAYPDDAEAAKQDQQWMLGEDVLVAPVVTPGNERDVYFPTGCWQHGETGERFTGPGSKKVNAPLDQLPYFLRCGVGSLEAAAGRVDVPGIDPPGTPGAGGRCTSEILGTGASNLLRGTKASDLIRGFRGADRIFGLAGSDCLRGGGGPDRLSGGPGRDVATGGQGDDVLTGGAGNDRLGGDAGDDRITGGKGVNTIAGGTGADTINAANGRRERIDCGGGNPDFARADRSDRLLRCERSKRVGRR